MAATTHYPSELDSAASDSVASSPRSDQHPLEPHPRLRFMCSFGGKILPRPHDNQLRYVGGDTRIVAIHRGTAFSALLTKLSKLSGTTNITVKYQLPNEDLDALITVTTDEDVENMMEEYDRLAQNHNPRSARLRLFLFDKSDDSRTSSINSLLDGSANREQWFFDALNGGGPPSALHLERGRSEASSIVSEVPDYLFGLDNSDENQVPREPPKLKPRTVLHENVSVSDPGSPVPAISSPFCSTSSAMGVPSAMPDLPPLKTKLPDQPIPQVESNLSQSIAETGETIVAQPGGYLTNATGSYASNAHYPAGPPVQPIPVYYIPGHIPPSNVPVQPIMAPASYVQHQRYPAVAGQVPVGYHQQVPGSAQVYGGVVRSVVADGATHPVYYGLSSGGIVPSTYPTGMVVPGGEDTQAPPTEVKVGRIPQQS